MINPASKDATAFATTEVGRHELIDAFTFHICSGARCRFHVAIFRNKTKVCLYNETRM
jgi:hypothetical protein